jgi:pimeloyl-ACP methyl ester carboxylesterase
MLTSEPREVAIPFGNGRLFGAFCAPQKGNALVVFAHGSGSSRHSPRNQFVASQLARAGFGTLLMDLLTEAEDRVYENRFDIPLLASRLIDAIRWFRDGHAPIGTPIALFGASTGAAAALVAASQLGKTVSAVVSRGGRPDLAGEHLRNVSCPTLLIVGELDHEVISLNKLAMNAMPDTTERKLEIVPGATHLFEEPGALECVADLTVAWLRVHAV